MLNHRNLVKDLVRKQYKVPKSKYLNLIQKGNNFTLWYDNKLGGVTIINCTADSLL